MRQEDITAACLVPTVRKLIADLPIDLRVSVAVAVLTDEICTLPPSERAPWVETVKRALPGALLMAEHVQRVKLAQKAREE